MYQYSVYEYGIGYAKHQTRLHIADVLRILQDSDLQRFH